MGARFVPNGTWEVQCTLAEFYFEPGGPFSARELKTRRTVFSDRATIVTSSQNADTKSAVFSISNVFSAVGRIGGFVGEI